MEQASRFNAARRQFPEEEAFREFAGKFDPTLLERTRQTMEDSGMLDALDEGFPLVLREFRSNALPHEEREDLRRTGFSDDEIETFFLLVQERGAKLWQKNVKPSEVFAGADSTTKHSIEIVLKSSPDEITPKKKRKILNGIGKVLGGSVTGLGNVLLLTGALTAPNPGGALASSAVAVTLIFTGLGDLRGE
jgi:hypothetical protein